MKKEIKQKIKDWVDSCSVDVQVPGIYDDASGITMMRTDGCSCCSHEMPMDEITRATIEKHFTKDDQKEIVAYCILVLMKKKGVTIGNLQKVFKADFPI